MTIPYRIIVGSVLNKEQIADVTKLIRTTFHEIDSIYNKWNPHSEISHLNDAKAGIEIPISAELEAFLHKIQSVVELSWGHFDPTIEPLQELWKNKLQNGNVPSEEDIAEIAPVIGWNNIRFGHGKFSKIHDKARLDFGGIAKGLCVDLIVERLNLLGYLNTFVEWGGEIRTSGKHPERPWTIFISRMGDSDPSHAITLLTLEDRAIATSGDYLQNWSVHHPSPTNGITTTTYFHIFDPLTFRPRTSSYTSIASASVAAPNCTLADGLATAAMMFPSISEAEAWANEITKNFPEISFWLISRESLANTISRK